MLIIIIIINNTPDDIYDICFFFRLAKLINMDLTIVIFRFKIIDLGVKFG